MKVVDLKNLECPAPVIETKKVVELGEFPVKLVVNSSASKENILRFLNSQNISPTVDEYNDETIIIVEKSDDLQQPAPIKNSKVSNNLLYISDDAVGSERELGKILLKAFIHTLLESETLPNRIIFVNRGVFVTTEWEDSIEDLLELTNRGVEIYSCGTCLNYYNIMDSLKVGVVGNAYDTVEFMNQADSVIKY
jgi:selenium metabolism protein YedF